MKLSLPNRRRTESGFLVIALFAIISIMLLYIGANLHVLAALKQDIRLIEQKQIQRLNKANGSTATVVTNSLVTRVLR